MTMTAMITKKKQRVKLMCDDYDGAGALALALALGWVGRLNKTIEHGLVCLNFGSRAAMPTYSPIENAQGGKDCIQVESLGSSSQQLIRGAKRN